MADPKVTVLLSAFNAAEHIGKAIESILCQTFKDFEFLIIDDGSTDKTVAIVEAFDDSRMRMALNEKNLGQAESLNRGIEMARGAYIARMDADDICVPTRLEMQVSFMDTNPSIDVCGSWVKTIGLERDRIWRYPVRDRQIRCGMLFGPALAHPAVFMRRRSMEKHKLRYFAEFTSSQDYDLWVRWLDKPNVKFANLPEVLLLYRSHGASVSTMKRDEQQVFANRVRFRQLAKLGLDPNAEQARIHESVGTSRPELSWGYISAVERWLLQIRRANAASRALPEPELGQALGRHWFRVCKDSESLGPGVFIQYLKSRLVRDFHPPLKLAGLLWGSLTRMARPRSAQGF